MFYVLGVVLTTSMKGAVLVVAEVAAVRVVFRLGRG